MGITEKEIELLAPGGDIDSIKAAIAGGADAVYCGLERFNARNSAENISFDDLYGILRLAHSKGCKVFLTLNIIIVESELPALITLLNRFVNTSIDGIIVQDAGVIYILSRYFKSLDIHASTQLTTHNEGQIKFLSRLGVSRANLSRELNIGEIRLLTETAHRYNILTEVFVHGSLCICFSGICYLSSVHGGSSGNRGRCSQPCRDRYLATAAGCEFPLNLKDNSAFLNLEELADAGVDSLKIEGRIKKFHYIYTVVTAWREQLQKLYSGKKLGTDDSMLYSVFNRGFTNGFLTGKISREMYADNPRDHSAVRLAESYGSVSEENLERAKREIYDDRTVLINNVKAVIDRMSIEKAPLSITVCGEPGRPLEVSVKSSDNSFTVQSEINLSMAGKEVIDRELLMKTFKTLNDTAYYLEMLDLDNLLPGLFLPFSELAVLKRKIISILNGLIDAAVPVELPVIKGSISPGVKPSLCILISSPDDLDLCGTTGADIYYQLPGAMKGMYAEMTDMFLNNKRLIPWFGPVLIGDDYGSAVEFLGEVQPGLIVSGNTGIAYEAWNRGISWIAGPALNCANSYSLKCLKEDFNCSGAFLSNELRGLQLRGIKKPENFNLYYSIYHPIELMTSRQCLFQQVDPCGKDNLDDTCLGHCGRRAAITNLKNVTMRIEKVKGDYHCIYNDINYLNTEMPENLMERFSGVLIDLRNIKTSTVIKTTKHEAAVLFKNYLKGTGGAADELHRVIHPTTCSQYRRGI